MKILIALILILSINGYAEQTVLINGVNFEIKEETAEDITKVTYYLSNKDKKKLCGSGSCKYKFKFNEAVNPLFSTFRTTCSDRGLYEISTYVLSGGETGGETNGRVYQCINSLIELVKYHLLHPNNDVEKKLVGEAKIKINNLEIVQLTKYFDSCNYQYLFFKGPVNEDTKEVIRRLLKSTERCADKYTDEEIPIFVFMKSGGGLLKDGFSIGELFKDNNVYTVVPKNSMCASSCTTAFLGGNKRFMKSNSTLLFHAPYLKQRNQFGKVGINCQTNNQDLKNYYMNMIGNEDGTFLYKRTMDFCSASAGWEINDEASRLFGIID